MDSQTLQALKNRADAFTLRKTQVMDESQWTEELIMLVGVRKLMREVKWQEANYKNTQSQKAKIAELEAKIRELEGNA